MGLLGMVGQSRPCSPHCNGRPDAIGRLSVQQQKSIFEEEEGAEGAPRSPETKHLQLRRQRHTTVVRCIPLSLTVSFISGEHHFILYRTRYERNRFAFFTLRSYIVSRTYRNYINYLGIQYSSTWNRMRTRNPHNIL